MRITERTERSVNGWPEIPNLGGQDVSVEEHLSVCRKISYVACGILCVSGVGAIIAGATVPVEALIITGTGLIAGGALICLLAKCCLSPEQ